ncbi:MAG: DNA alkylation repair protein [Planctomycetaceae bacterium]
MTLKECLIALEKAGTAQNRKIYARHGVSAEMFGVSYAELERLKKQIRTDDALAEGLWQTGNHDARVLATKIADPKTATIARLNRWAKQCDDSPLISAFAGYVSHTPWAKGRAKLWIKSKQDAIRSIGWTVVSCLATNLVSVTNASETVPWMAELLVQIEAEIGEASNQARRCQHNALIAIGCHEQSLRTLAIAAARRIGTVEIDHGETGCKTPDAVAYIEKTWAYREKTGRPARRRC